MNDGPRPNLADHLTLAAPGILALIVSIWIGMTFADAYSFPAVILLVLAVWIIVELAERMFMSRLANRMDDTILSVPAAVSLRLTQMEARRRIGAVTARPSLAGQYLSGWLDVRDEELRWRPSRNSSQRGARQLSLPLTDVTGLGMSSMIPLFGRTLLAVTTPTGTRIVFAIFDARRLRRAIDQLVSDSAEDRDS